MGTSRLGWSGISKVDHRCKVSPLAGKSRCLGLWGMVKAWGSNLVSSKGHPSVMQSRPGVSPGHACRAGCADSGGRGRAGGSECRGRCETEPMSVCLFIRGPFEAMDREMGGFCEGECGCLGHGGARGPGVPDSGFCFPLTSALHGAQR